MLCIIYTRVSTTSQNSGTSISLTVQETICIKYAEEKKFVVKQIYKEIHSAYKKVPAILEYILRKKNQIILITNVDRFSRNLEKGMCMVKTAIKNNNILHFINDNIIVRSEPDLCKLEMHLRTAELESQLIGKRVKLSKNYLMLNNIFSGGTIKYGYKVVNKTLVEDTEEQNIMSFIKSCLTDNVDRNEINKKMMAVTKTSPYVPIDFYNKNNDIIENMKSMTYKNVANLLNNYEVYKRGKLWNANTVKSSIQKSDTEETIIRKRQRIIYNMIRFKNKSLYF